MKVIKEIGYLCCLLGLYFLHLELAHPLILYYYLGHTVFVVGIVFCLVGIVFKRDK